MLLPEILQKLNQQIEVEFYSSNLYLQMASWCEANNYTGSASFLSEHADEEMSHMRRIFDYINDTGGQALIPQLEQPPYEYDSLLEVYEAIYTHECYVTTTINELVATTTTSNDYSTLNFLQWYVAEQHEEENLFMGIVERIKMVDGSKLGILMIDKELSASALTRASSLSE
ncbi:MAG: non-heme ferritin [Thiotrichaceae bacterium]|nr:non-heme ferritin [Thiotrichaceae bacterium]